METITLILETMDQFPNLNCIGKLYEKVIARNIRSHRDINNIIPQSQFSI